MGLCCVTSWGQVLGDGVVLLERLAAELAVRLPDVSQRPGVTIDPRVLGIGSLLIGIATTWVHDEQTQCA